MPVTSYAQNFEDVILHRALKEIKNGFYVDVGANDHLIDSVTKMFYDQGWSGINIEPIKQHFSNLEKFRPRDINVNCLVGEVEEISHFYQVSADGLSTISKEIAQQHEAAGFKVSKVSQQTRKLASILDQYAKDKTIHFLKIDVEGAELAVIRSIDFSKARPWIMVVEAMKPNQQVPDHMEWEPVILNNGYEMVYADGLNRFYLANEASHLKERFEYPPNVFDDFIHNRVSMGKPKSPEATLNEVSNKPNQTLSARIKGIIRRIFR
jgi:FkbM family methyltransferase